MNQNELVEQITATVPLLEAHGLDITKNFYKKLFQAHPALQNVFNMSHQRSGIQPLALAQSVLAYAKNIENPMALSKAIELIAHKHVSVGVTPEQYPIVGKFLLEAIKDTLSLDDDHPALNAWGIAFQGLAEVFIQVESDLRQKQGWSEDFIPFKVEKTVDESEQVRSFYLSPVSGDVPKFAPGQYISLKLDAKPYTLTRQYSLSHKWNPEFLRISVKREQINEHKGQGSHTLHESIKEGDEILCSRPSGEFILNPHRDSTPVFLSAGIGLTPLISMAQQLDSLDHNYMFIHADRNWSSVPKILLNDLKEKPTIFLEEDSNEKETLKGYMNLESIKDSLPQDAEYYICGPKVFMKAQVDFLKSRGVPSDHINFEYFSSFEGDLN